MDDEEQKEMAEKLKEDSKRQKKQKEVLVELSKLQG